MNRILRLWGVVALAVLFSPPLRGADRYVATNGAGSPGTNWVTAFTNIQQAIDTASDGDVLYLAAHTFSPPASTLGIGKLVWTNKTLTILGGYTADGESPGALSNRTTLIVNSSVAALSTNRILYVSNVTNGTLSRVTLRGGQIGNQNPQALAGDVFGAGLYVANCTNLLLDSVVIDGNYAFGQQNMLVYGAGLYALNSWGFVTNSVFKNNWLQRHYGNSSFGGGLHLAGGGWLLRDCVIRDNLTANQTVYGDTGRGVGIYVNGGTHSFKNCAITRNYGRSTSAPQGEALYLAGGTVTVENCTFYWHRFEGVRRGGGSLTLRSSIVWECGDDIVGAVALQNCDIQDGDSNGVANCFSLDPRFERGLYLATNSPCVNMGATNAADAGLAGRTTRIDGVPDADVVDMGYHFAAGVTDLYVSVNSGSDTNTGTSVGVSFKTIRKALSVARDGAHVHVAAGNYATNTETFPLTIPANSYGIQLLGTNAAQTTLNAAGANARVLSMSFNYPDARVTGVTLAGAYWQMGDSVVGQGGGLYAAHSRGIVDACVMSNNTIRAYSGITWGEKYGAGVYMAQSIFAVSNCAIVKNTSQAANYADAYGGGIAWMLSDGLIDSCSIVSNRAIPGSAAYSTLWRGIGGGVYLSSDGLGIEMRSCLIASNNAADGTAPGVGSGLYNAGAVALLNCTIATNRATGVYGAGAASLTNCIVWGNGLDVTGSVSAAYCDVGTGIYTDKGANLSADPLFRNALQYDFRLNGASPCVNGGVNLPWIWMASLAFGAALWTWVRSSANRRARSL